MEQPPLVPEDWFSDEEFGFCSACGEKRAVSATVTTACTACGAVWLDADVTAHADEPPSESD